MTIDVSFFLPLCRHRNISMSSQHFLSESQKTFQSSLNFESVKKLQILFPRISWIVANELKTDMNMGDYSKSTDVSEMYTIYIYIIFFSLQNWYFTSDFLSVQHICNSLNSIYNHPRISLENIQRNNSFLISKLFQFNYLSVGNICGLFL